MPARIILTTCSLNHIAQAKSLAESAKQFAPDYHFVIGLIDRVDGRLPAGYLASIDLIEVDKLEIEGFAEMCERYSLLELNCALKAYFTDYILKTYSPDIFIFLDSDMLLFHSLELVEEALGSNSILLTPHILSPYPNDDKTPRERTILKTGMFNAGFFALKNDNTSNRFVQWWKERMFDQCYEMPKEGLNVDQKWLNFVPFYFEGVKVLRHPGCNVAYWNFHERDIVSSENGFLVNGQPLIFFHYSGYSLTRPNLVSRHQSRFDLNDNPAIKELFELYQQALRKNRHEELLHLSFAFAKKKGLLQRLKFK